MVIDHYVTTHAIENFRIIQLSYYSFICQDFLKTIKSDRDYCLWNQTSLQEMIAFMHDFPMYHIFYIIFLHTYSFPYGSDMFDCPAGTSVVSSNM